MDETDLNPDVFTSPLTDMVVEIHEVYVELVDAGFPDAMIAQIISNMLSEAIMFRPGKDDEDDEDEDEGDLEDEHDE